MECVSGRRLVLTVRFQPTETITVREDRSLSRHVRQLNQTAGEMEDVEVVMLEMQLRRHCQREARLRQVECPCVLEFAVHQLAQSFCRPTLMVVSAEWARCEPIALQQLVHRVVEQVRMSVHGVGMEHAYEVEYEHGHSMLASANGTRCGRGYRCAGM